MASVKNFATYYRWTKRDELFHLKASLKGPAGQLLWDLGSDVSLEKLEELLKRKFGGADQEERFRMELRNRHRQPKEDLPQTHVIGVSWSRQVEYEGYSWTRCIPGCIGGSGASCACAFWKRVRRRFTTPYALQ